MRFKKKDVPSHFLVPEFTVLDFSVWNFLSRKIHRKFNSSEVILIKNHRDEAQNAPMNLECVFVNSKWPSHGLSFIIP